MQQKVFGELLGKSLWVRSTLGVNQPTMKAINLILQERGLVRRQRRRVVAACLPASMICVSP